jgi:hypothetical protein
MVAWLLCQVIGSGIPPAVYTEPSDQGAYAEDDD